MLVFITFFVSIHCLYVKDSFSFTSDVTKNIDLNFRRLMPYQGFGFQEGGGFDLDLTLSDSANLSSIFFMIYPYEPWLIYYASDYHSTYGETFLCQFPVYYSQRLLSGRSQISYIFREPANHALLLVKCEPGTEYGDVLVNFDLHLFNLNGQELSITEAPFVTFYSVFVGLFVFVFVCWLLALVVQLININVFIHVPLTGAFVLQIAFVVCKMWYYYKISDDGYPLFWTLFLVKLFEILAEVYLLACLFSICVGLQSFKKITKFKPECNALILGLFFVFVLMYLLRSVWPIPDTIAPIFNAGYYVMKTLVSFGILLTILVSRNNLQKFMHEMNDLSHRKIYHWYITLGLFFWFFAAYVSVPVVLSVVHFALMMWNQVYMYEILLQFNTLILYCAIVYCFRPVSFKVYKSILDNKKLM